MKPYILDSKACDLCTRPVCMQRQRSLFLPTGIVLREQFRALCAAEGHVYCLICWIFWFVWGRLGVRSSCGSRQISSSNFSKSSARNECLPWQRFFHMAPALLVRDRCWFQFVFVGSRFSSQVPVYLQGLVFPDLCAAFPSHLLVISD